MTDLPKKFDAIISDYEAALKTLAEVLRHIEQTKPDARLRVVLLNNTIVALTATIEEVLRGLFHEYLSILEDAFEDYRKLRKQLQKTNLECAMRSLKKLKTDEDLDVAGRMVTSLATCMNGHTGYRLLKENIVYNQGNFKSIQVTEISTNIGIPRLWQKVCDSAEIEDYTGVAHLDTRVNKLLAEWNEVFDERDLVVHRISQATGWAPQRIQGSIDLSRLVLKRISTCLLVDAQELIKSKSSSIERVL
jgi:hypothetical protein